MEKADALRFTYVVQRYGENGLYPLTGSSAEYSLSNDEMPGELGKVVDGSLRRAGGHESKLVWRDSQAPVYLGLVATGIEVRPVIVVANQPDTKVGLATVVVEKGVYEFSQLRTSNEWSENPAVSLEVGGSEHLICPSSSLNDVMRLRFSMAYGTSEHLASDFAGRHDQIASESFSILDFRGKLPAMN